jgi:hypothetical protein
MRARTVLFGSVFTLLAADVVLISLGTLVAPGPHNVIRHVVCGVGAYLLARRSDRLGNAVLAVATAAGSAALAILISLTPYVLTGQAVVDQHGPAILIVAILGATTAGLLGGVVGAGAGWLAQRWWPPREIAEAGRLAGGRRKFP